ncbi:restriction endonuclease subunit S [Zhongshania marina]|uniref:restriction endonuclease subunit S n=1 Tax=Zhongshania marina TaxID=2304603 RepID=UPI00131499C9
MSGAVKKRIPEGYKQTEVGVIPEDWLVAELGTLCSYQNGMAQESYFNKSSGYKVVSIGNYSPTGRFVSTGSYIARSHAAVIRKFILNKGDLAMILNDKTAVGTIIGRVLLIDKDDEYVMNQRTMRLASNGKISPEYLYFLINSDFIHKNIVGLSKPGTQIYINTDDVTSLPLCAPADKKEQTAIANALSDVDALITSLEKLIAKKRAIKTAAMQQLLTGKKRLSPFDQNHTGYKQTELGEIPEDWEVIRIGDIADVKTGPFGSSLHERDYVQDGTPIITVEHLGEIGISSQNLPMVSDLDRARLRAYSLRKGDIAFSRVGSVDRNALILSEHEGWLFSGRLLRVRFKNRDAVPSFFSHQFHTAPFKQRVLEVAVGQTMASLNTQILKGILVLNPSSKAERAAISGVLDNMNTDISRVMGRLEKTQQIKQGMMQELLTGRTRLI